MNEYDRIRQQGLVYKNQKAEYYQRKRKFETQRRQQSLKLEVLTHYSCGNPKCAYCGETDIRVLCIDHIKGDGNKQKRELGIRSGLQLFFWLRRNEYPSGFQVLCANCNMRKQYYQGKGGQFW